MSRILLPLTVGTLVFSPIGANWLLAIGGNFLPELLLIPIAVWFFAQGRLDHSLYGTVLADTKFHFAVLLSIVCASMGLMFQHGSVAESYASLRGFLFAVYGYRLSRIACQSHEYAGFAKDIQLVAGASIACSILYFNMFDADTVKRPYSFTAFSLLLLLLVQNRKWYLDFTLIGVATYCGITSSYRLFIVYAAILASTIFVDAAANTIQALWSSSYPKESHARSVAHAVLLSCILALGSFAFDSIYNWIASDPSRYHQVIYKFEQQYESLESGTFDEEDDQRVVFYKFILENAPGFLLPNGFYDRKLPVLHSIWIDQKISVMEGSPINDGGSLFMIMSFGIILTAIALGRVLLNFLQSTLRKDNKNTILKVGAALILLIIFMTQGNIILVLGNSFFFGVCLALITTRHQ